MCAQPVFEFVLPFATPSLNEFKGGNRFKYKKLREDTRRAVLAALQEQVLGAPVELAHVEVDRYCVGRLDWDNAYGGLKPLMDCLVVASKRNPSGIGLIRDDSPKYIPAAPVVRQLPAKKGASYTVVRIYAANDNHFEERE